MGVGPAYELEVSPRKPKAGLHGPPASIDDADERAKAESEALDELLPVPGAAQLSDALTRRHADVLRHAFIIVLAFALYLAHTLF
jgi:hypothetical protein